MSKSVKVDSVVISDIRALRAAIADLQRQGVKLELVEQAEPRLYFSDQLQRGGRSSEVCPFVLRVQDSFYDVGLLPHATVKGAYSCVFDDYPRAGHHGQKPGQRSLRKVLGFPQEGKATHGSDEAGTRTAIGKLLQGYSRHATINAARNAGYNVTGSSINSKGEVVLEIEA